MLTGAVLAVTLRNPLLVVPFALLSHFLLDTLPHFGVLASDTPERNSHPLFRKVLHTDIILAVLALIVLPILLHDVVHWFVVVLGMLAAWVPDTVWISHFIHDHKGWERKAPHWLTRFHQKIQWFEKPPGLITEIAWLAGTGLLLTYLAA